MKTIGILGSGDVAKALARGFLSEGYDVVLGTRDPSKLQAFASEAGPRASVGSFADAAGRGDLVVLATLGTATLQALELAGPGRFAGKVVIDTTNPLDFSQGFPPRLVRLDGLSGGEAIQRALPGARVVKAFNTVGNAHMYRPSFPEGRPDMFVAGDDDEAKSVVAALLERFGWGVADVGGIAVSGHLESLCMVWVLYALRHGRWDHAFKLLHRQAGDGAAAPQKA